MWFKYGSLVWSAFWVYISIRIHHCIRGSPFFITEVNTLCVGVCQINITAAQSVISSHQGYDILLIGNIPSWGCVKYRLYFERLCLLHINKGCSYVVSSAMYLLICDTHIIHQKMSCENVNMLLKTLNNRLLVSY